MTTHDHTTPHPAPTGTGGQPTTEVPNLLTHDQMRTAQDHGHATPLSRTITDFVRYQDHWWIAHPEGWILVDDPELATVLDSHHKRAQGGLYSGG